MQLIVDTHGHVHCLYAEEIDLSVLGPLTIHRASHVEPDRTGKWWLELAPVGGPNLGPFDRRSEALDAERTWLEEHWLGQAEHYTSTSAAELRPASLIRPSNSSKGVSGDHRGVPTSAQDQPRSRH